MKNLLILLSILVLVSCSGKHENITVITNVGLFDGYTYRPKMNISFKDDIIIDISDAKLEVEATEVIDGTGKTIIPPLLNAHVHIWNEKQLKEAMDAGVFGVLDMLSSDSVATEMRSYRNHLSYAYYYGTNVGATVPGGHGTEYGYYIPTVNDSVSPEKFVKDRVLHGADYIKIFRAPEMNTLSFEQTAKLINAAHALNKLSVAHVSYVGDATILSAQGIDGFVHIWYDTLATEPQWDVIVKSKAFIVPTLYVTKKGMEEWAKEPGRSGWLQIEDVLKETKKAYDKGIPVLAGTDAPNFNFNYGTDLYEEMKLLHQAGLPNIEVLKAATTNITRCFKLKEFGSIEKGKPASFILINGNPINDLNDLEKIEQIWRQGREIK